MRHVKLSIERENLKLRKKKEQEEKDRAAQLEEKEKEKEREKEKAKEAEKEKEKQREAEQLPDAAEQKEPTTGRERSDSASSQPSSGSSFAARRALYLNPSQSVSVASLHSPSDAPSALFSPNAASIMESAPSGSVVTPGQVQMQKHLLISPSIAALSSLAPVSSAPSLVALAHTPVSASGSETHTPPTLAKQLSRDSSGEHESKEKEKEQTEKAEKPKEKEKDKEKEKAKEKDKDKKKDKDKHKDKEKDKDKADPEYLQKLQQVRTVLEKQYGGTKVQLKPVEVCFCAWSVICSPVCESRVFVALVRVSSDGYRNAVLRIILPILCFSICCLLSPITKRDIVLP